MKLFRAQAGAALIAAALMLTACGGTDAKNPQSVAQAFMTAYAKKDPATMLTLMSEEAGSNRDTVAEAAKDGPTSQAYKDVFNDDMMKLMAKAKVEGPRYGQDGKPIFKVAEEDGTAYLIILGEAGGKWTIVTLDAMENTEYMAMPDKKPANT
jgi:hypothetical protein